MSTNWFTGALKRANMTPTAFAAAYYNTHQPCRSLADAKKIAKEFKAGKAPNYRQYSTLAAIFGLSDNDLGSLIAQAASTSGVAKRRTVTGVAPQKQVTLNPQNRTGHKLTRAQRAKIDAQNADRQRKRDEFAAWFRHAATVRGEDTVEWARTTAHGHWWDAKSIPALGALPEIAVRLNVPLPAVLVAAGRPPVDELRLRHSVDPHGSLPGLLRTWQETEGINNDEAAERCLQDVFSWARFKAGSKIPTLDRLVCISHGTGIDTVELAKSCTSLPDVPSALVDEARAGGTSVAKMARLWIRQNGTTLAGFGAALGVSAAVAKRLTVNEADAPLLAAFAALLEVPTAQLLKAAGYDTKFANRLGRSFDAARTMTVTTSFAQMLRTARVACGLTTDEAAAAIGYKSHAQISRWENGTVKPTFDVALQVCDAFRIDKAAAFVALGYAPAA